MPKVLALDYGEKRTGLAITDDLQMIASPLETVETPKLMAHLASLFSRENIQVLVVGEARYLNGQASATTHLQAEFVKKLSKAFPDKKIERIDEFYTSTMAAQAMLMAGVKKSDRQKKGNLDKVSAAIILQSYLEMRLQKR
jgi:putative holliday junction resolvase